ncbi:alginate biosynthesis TPR repeat lipoprotein AlgK [Pseudomonas sp. NCHU5208]|uniref:alginate biosynthesis TPR repeat lipoprotein AlgK n=1 Tax=unclassified Pseudomonas TaxID=196821 RepID=UPI003F9CF8BA
MSMPLLRPALLGLAVGATLAGCAGLPDERLAREALHSGDTQTAEWHFRQLAEMGYSDAQIGLADIYAASGQNQDLHEAERIYRQALDGSPRAEARLGKLLARKPGSTLAERREAAERLEGALRAGEPSALLPLTELYLFYPQDFPTMNVAQRIHDWRQEGRPQAELAQILLYRSEGSYDQHLGEIERICQQRLAQEEACYAELATVYQKQNREDARQALTERLLAGYRAGRVSPNQVEAVAEVLSDAELGQPQPQRAQELLEAIAPDYPAAWVSLARLLYDYPQQGDTETLLGYLDKGREAALPRAELLLGRLYYEGKLLPKQPHKAEEHLRKAAPSEPSANYYLGQIYLRGYLGEVYAQKALDHLLSAARAGQLSADFALAQMYSQKRGIQPDPVNAYVFSQLALPRDTPQTQELADAIAASLTPAQLAEGQRLLREEREARGIALQQQAALQVSQP